MVGLGVLEAAGFVKLMALFKGFGVAVSAKGTALIKGLYATEKLKAWPELARHALFGLQGQGLAFHQVGLAGAAKAILNFLLMIAIAAGAKALAEIVREGIEHFDQGRLEEGFACVGRAFKTLVGLEKQIRQVPELAQLG